MTANAATPAADRCNYDATRALRTTCPLKIKTMSRPFYAKFGGRCPLLGRAFPKGTSVRRIEFVNQDTGAEFTGIVPVDLANPDLNTLRLMDWTEGSGFIRAKEGDAARAVAAMMAGMSVTIITRSGSQKRTEVYSFRNEGQDRTIPQPVRIGGVSGRTVKAYSSSFTKHAVAWRAHGFAFADRDPR